MSHHVRHHYPLALVFLAVGLASAMATPFLTLFLTDAVHASTLQMTVFLIAAPLSSVLVATLLGHWSDRRPVRRRLIIGAALIGAAGALLTALVRDYWVLLALTVTATAVSGSLIPQVYAHARASLAGSASAVMTMTALRTTLSLSWVAGPFLATVLLAAGDFTLVYGFSSAMLILAALVAWRLLPGDTQPLRADGDDAHPGAGRNASTRVIALTMTAFVLLQCTGNLSLQTLPLFLTHNLGGSIGDTGLVLGLCAGLEIPLMLGFGLLSARYSLRWFVLTGPVVGLAYTMVVADSSHTWQVAVAQVLNASSIALAQGLGISYVQDMMPRRPGHASTLFSNTIPIGAMVAGPLLGMAQHLGYRSAYLMGAGMTAVALMLLLAARPERQVRAAVLGTDQQNPAGRDVELVLSA